MTSHNTPTPTQRTQIAISLHDAADLEFVSQFTEVLREVGTVQITNTRSQLPPDMRNGDGIIAVETPQGHQKFVLEVKRLPKQAAHVLIDHLKRQSAAAGLPSFLISSYISDALGKQLRSENIAYFDAAGNAWIDTAALHLWFRGFRPTAPLGRAPRLFGPAGLQLIATMLVAPDAFGWPYRKIAQAAGTSLSCTSDLLKELNQSQYVRPTDATHKIIGQPRELFQQWELFYPTQLRPKLSPQTYRSATTADKETIVATLPSQLLSTILIGGEVAAATMTQYLRPQRLTLHCLKPDALPAIKKILRLIPDQNGDIDLLTHFSSSEIWRWKQSLITPMIHPLFVHAELLSKGNDGRLRETAQMLYDQILRPTIAHEK